MTDPLTLSTRIIDTGEVSENFNRITQELTEIADGVAVVESFSHVWLFETGDGLVAFDSSGVRTGRRVVEAMRGWRTDRVHSLIYTHGHVDHVGGSGAFLADAEARSHAPPEVIGHEAVVDRLERYRLTNGWNLAINERQFGSPRRSQAGAQAGMGVGGVDDLGELFLPADVAWPATTYRDRTRLDVGGLEMHLHHARGETDDHTWTWIPDKRAICCGDLMIWVFPNAGNPQKVQRFPGEWAAALREMIELSPELILPAHGLPVEGVDRIAMVLDATASALEHLVAATLDMMNDGTSLDTIVHSVKVPADLADKPWLLPLYDEPEFVVRNIWRQYGGWWDANPAHLKPAPEAELAAEVAALAGGADRLVERARQRAEAGELRLACHLIELAAGADPDDADVHRARAEIYAQRRDAEASLMARGVYGLAARESAERAGQ